MSDRTRKAIAELLAGKELEAGAIIEGLGDEFVAAGEGLVFTDLGMTAARSESMGNGSKLDEVLDGSFDAYSAEQIADLPTGTLAELKTHVDAEVARRLEECALLLPKKRARKGK